MKKNVLIKGALTILSASIITRILGFIFRIYIAEKLGAEGMGLYQLITSLYMLVVTFATSGVSLAVSCMIAENIATNKYGCSKSVLKISILWALSVSIIVSIILIAFSLPISNHILRDNRTFYSILILAPSLPFMSISCCIKGYFYAKRKSLHPSNAIVIEQIIKMLFTIGLINLNINKNDAYSCAIVSLGMTIGEVASCIYMGIIYYKSKNSTINKPRCSRKIFTNILKISVPVQTSSTLNSTLRLAENILIIEGLKFFTHGNGSIATSTYGVIKGMVLPLLLFPTSFLQAIITVLIPELSGANAGGKEKSIRKACEKSLQLTLIMGIYITALFLLFPQEISNLFYSNPNVSPMIKNLCILCPLMYLEMVCVGILNAIGEQIASMKYKIIDSITRLALIWFFVPKGGVNAFLIIMVISNLFTSLINLYHLLKVTCLPLDLNKLILKPTISILLSSCISIFFKNQLSQLFPSWLTIILLSAIVMITYIILLFSFNCIGNKEISFIKTCFKSKKSNK